MVLAESDRESELKRRIHWSRRWTPTYLILIALLIFLLICYRWTHTVVKHRKQNKFLRHRSQQANGPIPDDGSDQGGSSSSSTLNEQAYNSDGTTSPIDKHSADVKSARKVTDERTPLLPSSSLQPSSPHVQSWQILKSFLMYQPGPLPAATASHNIVPSNGRIVVILLFLIPNLFYLFFNTPISLSSIIVLGDRAGLCFVVNLPILYLLGAKNQPLRLLIGRSYEDLNIFHRRLGEWMIVLASIHGICMISFFWPLFQSAGRSLAWFLSERIILLGILTFVSYLTIYTTSIGYVRQFYYEAFLVIHVLVQIAALILLFFHHSGSRPYVITALCIWVIDRILMRIYVVPVTLKAEATLADDEETVLLSIKVPVDDRKYSIRSFGSNICRGWRPGQHVFISISSLNPTAMIQAHPYSIASTPEIIVPNSEEQVYRSLNLIVRSKDGFTLDLLNHLKREQAAVSASHPVLHDLTVRIDGPYGSTDSYNAVRNADRKLFIAAGSGVAATFPFATAAASTRPAPRGTEEEVRTEQGRRFAHYWIARSTLHRSWLPEYVSSNPDKRAQGYPAMIPPSGTENISSTDGVGARESLLDEAVGWITRCGTIGERMKIAVVVSGPDGMVRGVRNRCARLVRDGWDIDVFVEKFGW